MWSGFAPSGRVGSATKAIQGKHRGGGHAGRHDPLPFPQARWIPLENSGRLLRRCCHIIGTFHKARGIMSASMKHGRTNCAIVPSWSRRMPPLGSMEHFELAFLGRSYRAFLGGDAVGSWDRSLERPSGDLPANPEASKSICGLPPPFRNLTTRCQIPISRWIFATRVNSRIRSCI